MGPEPSRRWRRLLWAGLLVISLIGGALTLAVRGLGHWLMVADPLEGATAIVVLAGDYPFRAVEAASVYRDGWAPEVWLQRTASPAHEAALARLGFHPPDEERSNRLALNRFGVPATAIRTLDGRAENTAQEVELVARELRRSGGRAVILVTSKPHSRRVKATWRALVPASHRAVVRYAGEDPFRPSAWWRSTRDALAVSREVLGLLNVWAGFPVQEGSRAAEPGSG